MSVVLQVFVFALGAICGSFLNAVIYRLAHGSSAFRGRSMCPHCKHTLGPADLVPLFSFFMLRGSCRYCRKKISWQYPLIELAAAILFVILWREVAAVGPEAVNSVMKFSLYAAITCFLIVIFVYDLKHYLILDAVVLPAAILAFIGNVLLGVSWWQMLIAAAVAGGFFATQFFVSRGTWIGGGDIRLGALMGLILSWPSVLVALFIAYISGGVIGMVLVAGGKKSLSSRVPFGTFLAAATFISMLYGTDLVRWYWEFNVSLLL